MEKPEKSDNPNNKNPNRNNNNGKGPYYKFRLSIINVLIAG